MTWKKLKKVLIPIGFPKFIKRQEFNMKINNTKILKNLEIEKKNWKLLKLNLKMSFSEILLLRAQFIEVCFDFDLFQLLIFLDKNSKTIT